MNPLTLPNGTTINPEKVTEIRKFEGLSMRFEIDAGGETFVVTEHDLVSASQPVLHGFCRDLAAVASELIDRHMKRMDASR